MKRLSVAFLLVLVAGCATRPPAEKNGYVYHVVICWLKDPSDANAREKLIAASRSLADLPGVVRVQAGARLPRPTSRPIDDTTFDVAVVITFENAQALEVYQVNPKHIKLQKEVLAPLTQRVIVYDATDDPSRLVNHE